MPRPYLVLLSDSPAAQRAAALLRTHLFLPHPPNLPACVQPGVRVISASMGSGGASQAMYDALATVCKSGKLFVASAGNSEKGRGWFPLARLAAG